MVFRLIIEFLDIQKRLRAALLFGYFVAANTVVSEKASGGRMQGMADGLQRPACTAHSWLYQPSSLRAMPASVTDTKLIQRQEKRSKPPR